MKRHTRLKLDTGETVEGFGLLHPHDNPAGKALTERLVALNDRADALGQQQRSGKLGVKSSVVQKPMIRREIRLDLEALHRITTAAAISQPEVAVRFTLPGRNVNHQAFLAATMVALSEAQSGKALLLGYGMPEDLLDRLGEAVGRYENAVNGKVNARARQVGASADLEAVADDIMEVVRHLDALNTSGSGTIPSCWRPGRAPGTSRGPARPSRRLPRRRSRRFPRRREQR